MPPRRIALLKPSALGDVVHALPVLSALRDLYPAARITWVVNRAYQPLIDGHPDLSDTLPFDRAAFRRPLAAVGYAWRFAGELRRRRFDLVVDLQGLLRTGLMCGFTGAPRRVGFDNAREGSARFYTDRVAVPDADQLHAVDRYWRVVEALGGGHLRKRFVVPLKPDAVAAAGRLAAGLPRPWVGVAVGARWLTKRWPPAHYAALLTRAAGAFGGSALFVGGGEDKPLVAEVLTAFRGPHRDLTGQTPLPVLAALLARCDAVVSNDTGPLHLAAALGRPCVAPYTCTQVVRHGPYGSAGGVETSVPCRGSYLRDCPNGLVCFPDLAPDRLWGPLASVLSAWPATSRSA